MLQYFVVSVLYQQNQNQEKQNTLDLETSDSGFDNSDDETDNGDKNILN